MENMGKLGPEAVEALALEVERSLRDRLPGGAHPGQDLGRGGFLVRRGGQFGYCAAPTWCRRSGRPRSPSTPGLSSRRPGEAGRPGQHRAHRGLPRPRRAYRESASPRPSPRNPPGRASPCRLSSPAERDPAFVSDELVLHGRNILGMMPAFYAMYAAFLEFRPGSKSSGRTASARRKPPILVRRSRETNAQVPRRQAMSRASDRT